MPPRRSHRKSRLGCVPCKKRKIKVCIRRGQPKTPGRGLLNARQCDEAPPPCANCRKHNVACEYGSTIQYGGAVVRHAASPASAPASAPEAASLPALAPAAGNNGLSVSFPPEPDNSPRFTSALNVNDLELMHHYTTDTYQTLSDHNEFGTIWQHYVPEEALAHPFLMHGLLSLSALHLIAQHGEHTHASPALCKYTELATMHQNLALVAFRPQLAAIDASNCTAVFAFSCMIAALAFAYERFIPQTGPHAHDPVGALLQDFALFRGVEGVLQVHADRIRAGRLGPLIEDRPTHQTAASGSGSSSAAPAVAKDVASAMDFLLECNGASPPGDQPVYAQAIRQLHVSFAKATGKMENVFRWPMVVADTYLDALRQRRPMALVVLAHYCVILCKVDGLWWSKERAKRLLLAVDRELEAEVRWRPLIRWPLRAAGLEA